MLLTDRRRLGILVANDIHVSRKRHIAGKSIVCINPPIEGEPVVRRGRKASGLLELSELHEMAGLPAIGRIPMNRVVPIIALTGVLFAGAQAQAVDSTGQSAISKRQMIVQVVDCMKKRMSADKNRSYNEAMKACKDQINKEGDDLSSGALVASDTSAKQ